MKSINAIIMLSLLIIPLAFARGETRNLLDNGDFEALSGNAPASWRAMKNNRGPLSCDQAGFHPGKYSSRLVSGIAEDGKIIPASMISAASGASAGKTYRLSFFARGKNDGQVLTQMFYSNFIKDQPHWYKRQNIRLTDDWKKYSITQTLPDPPQWEMLRLSIVFQVNDSEVWIDNVLLEEVVNEVAALTGNINRNLLENPGFDNGVNAWFIQPWDSRWQQNEAGQERDFSRKHHGSCSIKLHAGNGSLVSRRYPFKPGGSYTISFYARSEDKKANGLRAFAITADWKVTQLAITRPQLSEEWRRFSFKFKAPAGSGNAYTDSLFLRFDPHADIWLDSIQLEEGELSDYNPGYQAGIEPSTPYGIHRKDSGESVKVHAGIPRDNNVDLLLTLSATDIFGMELWKDSAVIKAGTGDFTTDFRINGSRLGVQHLSLSLAPNGESNRILASAQWRIAIIDGEFALPPNPMLGMDTDPSWYPAAIFKNLETLCSVFGCGMARTFIPPAWFPGERNHFNPENPEHVTEMRKNFAAQRQAGKSVMVVAGPAADSPLNLRNMRQSQQIPAENTVSPDIDNYAGRMASILKAIPEIDVLEILNEPNIWTIKGIRVMPPELYARMIATVDRKIRAAGLKTSLAANINGRDFAYVEKLLQLDVAKHIQMFTIHPYRANPETPSLYDDYRHMRAILDAARPGIAIANSEQYYGVRDLIHRGEYKRQYFSDSEEEQAGRMLQTALHGIAADKIPFSQFTAAFMFATPGISQASYLYHYFAMLRILSRHTSDLRHAENIDSDRAVRVFMFEKNDGNKVVSVNTRDYGVQGTVSVNIPNAIVVDANGNPVKNSIAVPVRYVPTYWIFNKGVTTGEIRRAFKNAICRGFEFPVEISARIGADNQLLLTMRNVSGENASGLFKIISSPSPWSFPKELRFDLKPGESAEYPAASVSPPEWNSTYILNYAATAGNDFSSGSLRLPSFIIPQTIDIPRVDGMLDDWRDAEWISLDENSLSTVPKGAQPHQGSLDLSAKVAFKWHTNGLYAAIKVTDDVLHRGDGAERSMYSADSIQFYFDLRNNATEKKNFYDQDDIVYTIGFGPGGSPVALLEKSGGTRYVGEANVETGIDGEIVTGFTTTDSGYVFEIHFPAATLPFLNFSSGSVTGISLLINDNDGQGRKQGLTLGPKNTEPFRNPVIWKSAQLGGSNTSDKSTQH